MNTLEVIKEILEEKQGISPDRVIMEASFEDLKIDSLDLVELVCAYEDKTGIDFGDPNPNDLKTIGDVVNYIDSL